MRNKRPGIASASASLAVLMALLMATGVAAAAAARSGTPAPPPAEAPPAEGLAQAQPSPAPDDPAEAASRLQRRAAERERLFGALARAQTEAESKLLVTEIWAFWFEPPNGEAGRLMGQAQERRRRYDPAGALRLLDELVGRVPDWAEGWNQRATVRFEMGRFDESLDDIEKVLALEPNHFGAMAGQAVILMHQGRHRTARSVLERAIEVHPFLPERRYILPVDGPDRRT